MGRLVRTVARTLVRVAVGAGVVAGAVALARAAIGRSAGEPGVEGSRHTPMSFDSWPPVPQAPSAAER